MKLTYIVFIPKPFKEKASNDLESFQYFSTLFLNTNY